MANTEGGIPRRLATEPYGPSWPSWSRDGQSIYFRSHRSGPSEVWKMPAKGGDAVQITHNTGDLPEESRDGKFLYYMKGEHYPEQCSIWRMPTGGGEENRVIDSTGCISPYAVGAQGIYFITPSDKQGHRDISLYNFSNGHTRTILTIDQPRAYHVAVSPDDRAILYTQPDQSGSDLMLVENFR